MGDFSTRLARFRHQALIVSAIGLVAFSFSSQTGWGLPKRDPATAAKAIQSHLQATTATAPVASGAETLELSARLMQNSINYADRLDWTVKSSDGELLFAGASQILTLPLKPGSYRAAGHYGNVHFEETINLPTDLAVSINYVLNAGALRIAPHLTDEGAATQPSVTQIFALGGADAGQMVKASRQAGEVIKLAAGQYRIETHFPQGNVSTSTEVEVKPGLIRAVDIAFHAGVVEFPALSEGGVWTVSSGNGQHLALANNVTELTLTPGAYVAESKIGSRMITKSFIVQDGDTLRLSLD